MKFRLEALRRRLQHTLQRSLERAGRAVPSDAPTLLDELSRLFLSDLVAERVAHIAAHEGAGARGEAALREDVRSGYASALGDAITLTRSRDDGTAAMKAAQDDLAQPRRLLLMSPLDDADLATPVALRRRLARIRPHAEGLRAAWRRAPLAALPSELVAHVWLGATQQVAMAVVLHDYRGQEVPESTRAVLDALLDRIDAAALRLHALPPIAPRDWCAARLQVAHARHAGRVHLPLRPIATAALGFDDPAQRYAGRADDEPKRLARQLRHADGVVLVTGYRGVGKSSFVNRALHHATQHQDTAADGWLVVPVLISVAKSSGVANVLRLALRSIKDALIDEASSGVRSVAGAQQPMALPLSDVERELLALAYIRATWKVAFSRSALDQGEWSAGVGLSIDPGKMLGGALAPLASLSAKRSRVEKLSRELSLRDYDEDAAEGDIARLIQSLARPRHAANGRELRIRLVLVFDELDKLDFVKGVEPLLDGLKNLFLCRHAVFVLVTSKQMYYRLRDQRSVEDATLSSYFSAVVHVPLLDFQQVRALLDDWTDSSLMPPLPARAAAVEAASLDRLARYLSYKSLGNPRDLIRELRHLQSWGSERPFITEAIVRLPEVAVYAAVQKVIEQVAVPWQGPRLAAGGEAAYADATLASDRVSADEARLEQLRRRLYILVEAVIDRQTLPLDGDTLEPLRANNLSLYSLADVQRLARLLGRELAALRSGVVDAAPAGGEALFVIGGAPAPALGATAEFYRLTGRHAASEESTPLPAPAATPRTPAQIADEALALFEHGGRAERWSAISRAGQLADADVPPALVERLRRVVHEDTDLAYRTAAIESTPPAALLDAGFNLAERMDSESDDHLLGMVLAQASEARGDAQRDVATDVLLHLLRCHDGATRTLFRQSMNARRPGDGTVVVALERLAMVARSDVTPQLKRFLLTNALPMKVIEAGVRALLDIAKRLELEPRELLLADAEVLKAVHLHAALAPHMAQMAGTRFTECLHYLSAAPEGVAVDRLARPVVSAAAAAQDEVAAHWLLDALGEWQATQAAVVAPTAQAILTGQTSNPMRLWLATPDFEARVLPWLRLALQQRVQAGSFDETRREHVEAELREVSKLPVPDSTANWAHAALLAGFPALASLAGGRPGAAAGELGKTLWDHVPWQPAGRTGSSVFANMTSMTSMTPPPRREISLKFDPAGALLVLAGVIAFAATLFIPGDVPVDAGIGTIFLSRFLSLCLPLSGLVMYLVVVARTDALVSFGRLGKVASASWADQLGWLPGVLGVLAATEAHRSLVGPISFGPQAIFFLLDSLAVGSAYVGVQRMVERTWSSRLASLRVS